MKNLSTALTFKCGHISNSSWGSLSSPGAGSYTNVIPGPRVQLIQSIGNTPRVVLYWYNSVLCTWTPRCIAHLFMVGERMEGRRKRREKWREKSRRDDEVRKKVEETEMRKRKEVGNKRVVERCMQHMNIT